MTEHELKEMKNLGAELGAAKAENDRLRGLLAEVVNYLNGSKLNRIESGSILHRKLFDALSPQTEPTDTYTAVAMATAAAQGFRDGQAAVEQAPAQDGWRIDTSTGREILVYKNCSVIEEEDARFVLSLIAAHHSKAATPHTEQRAELPPFAEQVLGKLRRVDECFSEGVDADVDRVWFDLLTDLQLLAVAGRHRWVITQQGRDALAAPIAQTAPQPERWQAACGDWRETSVAIHGEKSGYITCGIPEDKAHAIIKAHNSGLSDECAALSAQGAVDE